MGSFNTSCFASQQTIAPGDACYVLPIIQAKGYEPVALEYDGKTDQQFGIAESTCYPGSFWDAYGGFLEARYVDYGQFSIADTPLNRIRLLCFIRSLWERPVKILAGENESHDLPFDLANTIKRKAKLKACLRPGAPVDSVLESNVFKQLLSTWDAIWEVAHEHRLFGVNWDGTVRPVQFAVMHKRSFDTLVGDVSAMTRRKEPLYQGSFFQRCVARTCEALELLPSDDLASKDWAVSRFASRLCREFEKIGNFEELTYPCETEEVEAMTLAFFKGNETSEQLYARLKPTLDARYVMEGLLSLNLRLSPMVYAGLDYSNAIGSRFANFVARVSASVTQDRNEESDDE